MLTQKMIGGSYKFSDLLKEKKTKKKKLKSDPSVLGYPANKSNLNIIMKGSDGNLYKNKRYKKTKRWVKINKVNKKKK
tara:strand:- start:228 stop:461 length:234 start_codon:yes stop_codon:yes gene_type:complete